MKKKTFIILILPAIILTGGYFLRETFATSNPHDWSNGLVGYWSFDGQYTTSTDGTADISGNGNYGQFKNGVKPTAGVVGQAMYFDGVDDKIVLPTNASLTNITALTIEMWVKTSKSYYSLLSWGDDTSDILHDGYHFGVRNSGGIDRIFLNGSNNSNWQFAIQSGATAGINNNGWHYVAVTHDGVAGGNATDHVDFYLDGVLVGGNNIVLGDINMLLSAGTYNKIEIGHGVWLEGGYWTGGIQDEIRVYNRELSAGEIKQHYEQTRRNFQIASVNPHDWSDGLVGYWSFDGQYTTSTDGTKDISETGNYGQFKNGAKPTGGIVGQALSFDGINDYVNCGVGASLNLSTFTLELWVKPGINTGNEPTVIHKKTLSGDNLAWNYRIWLGPNGVRTTWLVWVGDGSSTLAEFSIAAAQFNTWQHIAFTFDNTAHAQKTYFNGVLKNTYSNAINPITTESAPLLLGCSSWSGSAGSEPFKGLIDEVRIYNRALSAGEVKQHYEQTRRNMVISSNPHDWTDGLLVYWSFDGQYVAGTSVTDQAGGDSNGTLSSTSVLKGGIVGQGVKFDGIDQYMWGTEGGVHAATVEKGTIDMWIKADDMTNKQGLFQSGDSWGIADCISFVLNYANPQELSLHLNRQLSADKTITATSLGWETGSWHHVIATWDTNTDVSKIYVDGVNAASGTTVLITPDAGPLLRIGTVYRLPDAEFNYFNGQMDEVRIYNRALSAGEVLQHYEQTRRNLNF